MPSSVTKTRREGRLISQRPFYTAASAVTIISLLSIYSFFLRTPAAAPQHASALLEVVSSADCHLVHQADDRCAFVRRNCKDDEAGLLQYLTFYYCAHGAAQPVAFIALIFWLGLLFTTIGLAASDFFSVNLSTIATVLHLSESLAGVTFLAFGNGSPDVFSTFAAMGSNSGSMAVGELIGAASFITAVVAGSMALVREFKVSRKTFVRDICFFIVAVGFTVFFLYDGNIHLWECCAMIGYYVFYVIVVVGWHAYTERKKRRLAKIAAARSSQVPPELGLYSDDPEGQETGRGGDLGVGRRGPATVDIGILDRAPRIEVGNANGAAPDNDEDDDRHAAAEVTSSMRVLRPRGRRSTTTITPIRPSLIGALEFRSVLASLEEERNMRMSHIHVRSYSEERLDVGWSEGGGPAVRGSGSAQTIQGVGDASVMARNRALSSGAIPPVVDEDLLTRPSSIVEELRDRGRSPSAHTIGGMLAPPMTGSSRQIVEGQGASSPAESPSLRGQALRISMPSPNASGQSSPVASPFPRYTDSPLVMTPNPQQPSQFQLPPAELERQSSFLTPRPENRAKPTRWWPYQWLPAPQVLTATLFPTMQGWRTKTIWDKMLSLASVPSVFLLVITLPVIESDTTDDDPDSSIMEHQESGHHGHTTAPVAHEPSGEIEPETEWQRYRRSTRSRDSSAGNSPALRPLITPHQTHGYGSIETMPPRLATLDAQPVKPPSESGRDNSTLVNEDQDWNRWLLILQIFTGPMFAVVVFWANMAEDLKNPRAVLVKAVLVSLVCSLVLLLILLLTTTAERRPKWSFVFCFLGFGIAIAWISTVAGEVVGVLKAFGVILNISEAILGLTIFAVGNSVGDLVADITVARLGYPVMALSACFGGPLLNILLGIGLGGAYQTVQSANKRHAKHPDRPIEYRPYHIQVGGTLLVSTIVLLITLLALLVAVPMNKWVMNRKIGFGLIALWSIGTVVNLVIEITGLWREIA